MKSFQIIRIAVADDLGYSDVAFNPLHPKEITTPHLDALTKQSIICRQGEHTIRFVTTGLGYEKN